MPKITYTEAHRRYVRAFAPVMIFYAVFCFAGPALLSGLQNPPRWVAAVVALVTGLPIAIVFWLMGRQLRETDEYTRKIQIDALLVGGGVTLSSAAFWGFLELFKVVPRVEGVPSMMFVAPTFFAAWGLAYLCQRLRSR